MRGKEASGSQIVGVARAGLSRPGFLSASDAKSQSLAYTCGVNRESMVMQGYTGYYHYDGRGSVANITGLSGETMVSYIYTDFGVDTAYPGAKNPYRDNPYRYNGERLDYIHGAPDLQFLRARYYDAASGRFTSRDTYWGKINVPLSQNLYTYTMNNPVKYADPSGHYVEEKQAYLDQIASLNEQISSMQNAMYNSGLSTRSAIQDELDRLNRSLASSGDILAMIEGQMSYQQAFPKQDRMIAEAESASARVSCESDWKDFFFTTDIALGILASLAKNLYSSFMFYPELMEDFVNSMSGRNSIGGMLNDFNSLGFVEYDGGYAIEEFYRQYAKNDLKFYAGSALGDVITIIGGYATTVLGFATVSVGADGQIGIIVPGLGTAVAAVSAGVVVVGTAVTVEGAVIANQGMQNLGHSIDRIIEYAESTQSGSSETSSSNRVYKPNDGKHKKDAYGDISADPFWNNYSAGQESLNSAYSSTRTKQLYNVYDGKLVKFQPDNAGTWHAYEVTNPAVEVPTDVLRNMHKDGVISKAQYLKWIKGK